MNKASDKYYVVRFICISAIAIVLSLLLVGFVYAQELILDNLIDKSLSRMEDRFNGFANYGEGGIQTLLVNTFYLLAVIEFSWAMIKVILYRPVLQSFLSVLVSRILFISFFSWLLQRGSQTAHEIFESFVKLAELGMAEGGVPAEIEISPGNIFDAGQATFARMYTHATEIGVLDLIFDSDVSITTPMMMLFVGIFVIITMTILAAHFGVVLLETFIAATAGIILLALGSSRWTYQYAVTYLKYAFSVGVKLFVFSIIVLVTLDEIEFFLANYDPDSITNLGSLLTFCIFSTALAAMAPKAIRGMVEGVSVGQASADALGRANPTRVVSKTTGRVNKLLLPSR